MTKNNAQPIINSKNYVKRDNINEFIYLGTVMCEMLSQLESDFYSEDDIVKSLDNFMRSIIPLKNRWVRSLESLGSI